ncbi:MAG: hypothetical protein FWD69_10190 [Polyangiaceae bacterium]|nr:hypothetical protein [Polyangiaceae bacterium]
MSKKVVKSETSNELIIAGVARDIAECKWSYATSLELQAKHGVTQDTVARWVREAERQLRGMATADRESLIARNSARLDHIISVALKRELPNSKTGELYLSPDTRTAVAAVAEQDRLLGLHAPIRVEHAVLVAQWDAMPPATKRARLLAAQLKIAAALAALPADGPDGG